ncbi:MAG: glycosyltransferase [Gammaproteobacteria bacterium]|nr:glycosyltransferase [Gammaproteobacteria bacterium]
MSSNFLSAFDEEQPLIAICVPTWLRPKLLSNCLSAIAKLTCPEGHRLCLIVVDNDASGSATTVFNELSPRCPFDSYYFCEPRRGYASVRNRLLLEAVKVQARYAACVDDDEFVPCDWLVRHIQALQTYAADVSHGPVIRLDEDSMPGKTAEKQLSNASETGSKKNHVSSGNVVFDLKLGEQWGLRFDPFYNAIGGEDHDFFDRSKTFGAKWIWTKEAFLYEWWPPERQTRRYLFSRHQRGGKGNVLKYRRSHSVYRTWVHFIFKITGKFLGVVHSLLSVNTTKAIRDSGTVCGYIGALFFKAKRGS